jgi:hypothetical protein
MGTGALVHVLGFSTAGNAGGARKLPIQWRRRSGCGCCAPNQWSYSRSATTTVAFAWDWLLAPRSVVENKGVLAALAQANEQAIVRMVREPARQLWVEDGISLPAPFPETNMPTLPFSEGLTAAPNLRPHWEGIRSSETEDRTLILFENLSDSGVVVEVNWIDFNGQEIPFGWLEPGKSRFQPTYVGHPWIIRDSNTGEVMLLFVTQNAFGTAVVHSGHQVEYSYPL